MPEHRHSSDGDADHDHGDEVLYRLDAWAPELRAQLEQRLGAERVPFQWERGTLVVAAEHESHVDRLVEELGGEAVDDKQPELVWEWSRRLEIVAIVLTAAASAMLLSGVLAWALPTGSFRSARHGDWRNRLMTITVGVNALTALLPFLAAMALALREVVGGGPALRRDLARRAVSVVSSLTIVGGVGRLLSVRTELGSFAALDYGHALATIVIAALAWWLCPRD